MNFVYSFLLLFFICLNTQITSSEIKIKYLVDDQIITNFDIEDEKNYLLFINPNLKELKNYEIDNLARRSLIREKIKSKELKKTFKIKENYKFLDDLLSNFIARKNLENKNDLKDLLKQNKLDYDLFVEKLKYEGLWNQLIYMRFKESVNINKSYLKEKLSKQISRNKKYEYNLSEILFEINKDEKFEEKLTIIKSSINNLGFKNTANKFSISNTSNKGGEIGWVKETLLSEDLIQVLSSMRVNEFSKPLKFPNGYLILRINGKKILEQNIDLDKELEDLIKFETNKQLNQFSLLYYKRLKQNIIINEY